MKKKKIAYIILHLRPLLISFVMAIAFEIVFWFMSEFWSYDKRMRGMFFLVIFGFSCVERTIYFVRRVWLRNNSKK